MNVKLELDVDVEGSADMDRGEEIAGDGRMI